MAAVEHDLVSMVHESKWWNRVMQVLTASGTNYKNAANRLRMLTAAGIIHADMGPGQVIEQHGLYETRKMLHLLANEKPDRARELAIKDVLAAAQKPQLKHLLQMTGGHPPVRLLKEYRLPLLLGGLVAVIAIRWIMQRII